MKILFVVTLALLGCLSMRAAQAQRPPIPCKHATAAHIACVLGVTDDAHWRATTIVTLPAAIMPWQGNTTATMEAAFPTVVEWAWRTNTAANLNLQMTRMPDLELARFSHFYWVETHGNITPVLMYASQKLTAANLVKLRAAFGAAATDPEVATYAPAGVKSAYTAAAKRVSIKQSHAAYTAAGKVSRTINAMPTGVAAPNVWMTPTEIYMEYIWAGAETSAEAAFLAAKYIGGPTIKAFTWGYTVGTAYYTFGISKDPDFAKNLIDMMNDAYADDFGPIDTVTGYGYIDGPITEVTGSGGAGGTGGDEIESFHVDD